MKKIICILSALILALTCFAGCQNNSEDVSGAESKEMGDASNLSGEASILVSENQLSLEVQIDDDVYAFPIKYETFLSYGWAYDGDDTVELEPNANIELEGMSKGNLKLQTVVINLESEAKPVSECYVGGITVTASAMNEAGDVKLYLPRGFECFSATVDKVRAEYGTPTYEETMEDGSILIEYEYDYFQVIRFLFDDADSLLSELENQKMVLSEDQAE